MADKMQKKKKRLIFRVVILSILAFAIGFALYSNLTKDEKKVLQHGDDAPNFQLPALNAEQETLALKDYEGKGVMVNFWATYCKPCKDEMPFMQELYPKYKKQGVEIIGVNLDQSQLVIERFINEYDLTFPIVHDKQSQVMNAYNVGYLPATFFINKDGEIVRKVIGPLTLEKLDGYLEEITPNS